MSKIINILLVTIFFTSVLHASKPENNSEKRRTSFILTPQEKAESDRKIEEVRKRCQERGCSQSR